MSKSRKQLFSGIFSIVHILFFVVYLCLPDVDPLILVFLDTASRCNIPKVLWKHSRESRRWGLSFGLGFLVCKPNPKHGNQPMFGVMRQKKWNINNQCCFTSKPTNNTNAYLYVLWGMPSSKKQNYTQKQMFVITFCKNHTTNIQRNRY